jgi:hypothetical protein
MVVASSATRSLFEETSKKPPEMLDPIGGLARTDFQFLEGHL